MADKNDDQRIQALLASDKYMSTAKAETLLYRWKKGRQAPSIKKVDRILRKAGLDDRSA